MLYPWVAQDVHISCVKTAPTAFLEIEFLNMTFRPVRLYLILCSIFKFIILVSNIMHLNKLFMTLLKFYFKYQKIKPTEWIINNLNFYLLSMTFISFLNPCPSTTDRSPAHWSLQQHCQYISLSFLEFPQEGIFIHGTCYCGLLFWSSSVSTSWMIGSQVRSQICCVGGIVGCYGIFINLFKA